MQASASPATTDAATVRASRRAERLESALLLRRLYRNLFRADPLLQLSSPVYQPPEEAPELDANAATSVDIAAAAAAADEELLSRVEEAVFLVAEMELTAEELRMGLRALKTAPERFGSLFKTDDPAAIESKIEQRVREVYSQLVDRVAMELPLLPFPSISAAQSALDSRNARYRATTLPSFYDGPGSASDGDGAPEGGYYAAEARRGLSERLGEAERVAERFVARRLQPAVARVRGTSPQGFITSVKSGALWARGVWDRLNGAAVSGGGTGAPEGLPLPTSTDAERAAVIKGLHGEIEELENKLIEASKLRETRLRKAGIQGRARMAAELRQMDNEVAALSRALAVRTLQLEMEYIYGCLESEATDILGDPAAATQQGGGGWAASIALALARRGSTDEIALLAAEFKQLDAELAALAAEVEAGGSLFIDDGELAALATEVPDLRLRLGVGDSQVFGGSGFSLVKVQMQTRQSVGKIIDGINFGVRGVRLLGADVGAAGRLFWRALLGGTLKPREVAALRRTARDLLTFIPFAVILILPLSPIGHVLIFGFIQRYFPGFFPSQFTSRRQDLMMKYEELKRQLREAQAAAEAEGDEADFRRAAAAVAAELGRPPHTGTETKLDTDSISAATPNTMTASGIVGREKSSSGSGGGVGAETPNDNGGDEDNEEGPAAAAVRKLEQELAAAADSSYTDMEE